MMHELIIYFFLYRLLHNHKSLLQHCQSPQSLFNPMIHAVLICLRSSSLFEYNPSRWSNVQSILQACLGWPSFTPLHQSAQLVVQKIYSLSALVVLDCVIFLMHRNSSNFLASKAMQTSDGKSSTQLCYSYFVSVVDGAESELGILDLIQVRYDIWSLVA